MDLQVDRGKCLLERQNSDFVCKKVTIHGTFEERGTFKAMEAPNNIFGLCNLRSSLTYYRSFVPRFSLVAAPLKWSIWLMS